MHPQPSPSWRAPVPLPAPSALCPSAAGRNRASAVQEAAGAPGEHAELAPAPTPRGADGGHGLAESRSEHPTRTAHGSCTAESSATSAARHRRLPQCRPSAALPAAPQPRAGACLLWPKLSLRTVGAARPDWLLGFNALKSSRGACGLEGLFRHAWLPSVLQDRGRPSRRRGVLPPSPRSSVGGVQGQGPGPEKGARPPTRLQRRVGDTGGAPLAEPGQERGVCRWVGVGFAISLSGSSRSADRRGALPGGASNGCSRRRQRARAEAGFPARALRRRRG